MDTTRITLTLIIVIFTCIISYQGLNNRYMKDKFSMHPASVNEFGQWYRLLTSGFFHVNYWHLGVNMFVLWSFGESLEIFLLREFGDLQGRLFYLFIYLGAVIFSSLPAYFKNKDNQYYSAIGASGGVAAVLFSLAVINPWGSLYIIFIPFVPIPLIVFSVIYLIYESYQSKKGNTLIGHDAHIAGAIYGLLAILLIAFIFDPSLLTEFFERLKAGPM